MEAAAYGSSTDTKLLLASGADLNAKDNVSQLLEAVCSSVLLPVTSCHTFTQIDVINALLACATVFAAWEHSPYPSFQDLRKQSGCLGSFAGFRS